MQYSLLIFAPERAPGQLDPDTVKTGRAAFDAYAKELDAAGALVSADMLQPSIATTIVSVREDEVSISGRRPSDALDQLMGTFVIDVADREAAIEWAQKCPAAAWGAIEVRPSALQFSDGAWHLPAP